MTSPNKRAGVEPNIAVIAEGLPASCSFKYFQRYGLDCSPYPGRCGQNV